jgi:putative ABC transport system permease protein
MPPGANFMVGMSGAPMPIKFAEALRKLPHVALVSPVNSHFEALPKPEVINGVDFDSFDALKPFSFVAGEKFQGPDDAIVDDIFASSTKGIHVGDTIKIMNHDFRISGIVQHGKGARKMIPLETMGRITDAEGKASLFYIKLDDPANDKAVIKEIHAAHGLEDYPVWTVDEWQAMMTADKLPGFNIALNVVRSIAVIVGFLAIFQSMYTAVLERTREIGILKSMGASKLTIVDVVLRETAVMALAGVVLGVAATVGVKLLVAHLFPTQRFEITTPWVAKGAAIAFVGAMLGALYPAWMAARKDPIDALAYE